MTVTELIKQLSQCKTRNREVYIIPSGKSEQRLATVHVSVAENRLILLGEPEKGEEG